MHKDHRGDQHPKDELHELNKESNHLVKALKFCFADPCTWEFIQEDRFVNTG